MIRTVNEASPLYPQRLPVIPLREAVIFPELTIPIGVGRPRSVHAVEHATLAGHNHVILVAQREADKEDVAADDLYQVGTVAEILRFVKLGDGSAQVMIRGIARAKLTDFKEETDGDFLSVHATAVTEDAGETTELAALFMNVKSLFATYTDRGGAVLPEVAKNLRADASAGCFADILSSSPELTLEQRQLLLEDPSVSSRLRTLSVFLNKQLEIMDVRAKLQQDVQQTLDKGQREFILREQMKAIQKELGEGDGTDDIEELRTKVTESEMPTETKTRALKEVARLERLPAASPEVGVVRNYVDWLLSLPWKQPAPDVWDVNEAARVLDSDHHGLPKIKDRILEYMAVRKLAPDLRAPILCFVGPPGVGKTSLGKSIAKAMGRKFVRMSLGGVHDEAEIRGHRRTYIGALPGRILQSMKTAGEINPVFMLDEIDKVGADFRGDPSSALLEVLDPEQNNSFSDHYLEVPYDLSKVMFITTANVEDTILPPLRDRMEIIRLAGYTEAEKLRIATDYLLPRQLAQHGLLEKRQPDLKPEPAAAGDAAPQTAPTVLEERRPTPQEVAAAKLELPEEVIRDIVRHYTREAGVRNLEREIATICRKVARLVASDQTEKVSVTLENLPEYLGPRKFDHGLAEEEDQVGAVTGVSVSEYGGDVLTVEATIVDQGSKQEELILTGQLQKVMEESARIALSYVRAHGQSWGIPSDFFKTKAVHIHVPAGAIPKDGPSAGVTMTTAIVSALSGRKVRPDVAMTGEITLRGKVLPIGGLKEKMLAAHRAGIKTFIFPDKNKKDLVDIPKEILQDMAAVPVSHVEEVLKLALVPGGPSVTPAQLEVSEVSTPTVKH